MGDLGQWWLPIISAVFATLSALLIARTLLKRIWEVRRFDRLVTIGKAERSALDRYVDALLAAERGDKTPNVPETLHELANLNSPGQYVLLAYMLWAAGEVDRAIKIAETGLKAAERDKARNSTILRLKNSLAYYYADARLMEKEQLARDYVEEAYRGRPEDPAVKDTLGYVKIVFGKSKKEVLEGLEICEQARKQGYIKPLFEKHLSAASRRLAELNS